MKTLNPQLYNDLCAVEELLIEEGWCKHISENDQGAHCVRGAIGIVLWGKSKRGSRLAAMEKLLRKHTPNNSLVDFNDAPTTTFEDILACLRTARKELTDAQG